MKKGIVILVLLGLAIVIGLSLAPVRPPDLQEQALNEQNPADNSKALADSLVDLALDALETGSMPPMQAIMSIRDVAERFPENVKAQFTLGVMSLQTGQNEKAVERMKRVIDLNPQEIEAYRILAKAQVALGQTEEARETLRQALEYSEQTEQTTQLQQELSEIQ